MPAGLARDFSHIRTEDKAYRRRRASMSPAPFCHAVGRRKRPGYNVHFFTTYKKTRKAEAFRGKSNFSALAELQGLGADPAKHPVISSLST